MRRRATTCLLLLALTAPSPAQVSRANDDVRGPFVDRVWQLVVVVEAEHIDPPTRHVMLEAGIESLAESLGVGLSTWMEDIPRDSDPGAIQGFLGRLYGAALEHGDQQQIAHAMLAGISHMLPGGAITVDEVTAKVNDSLAGNRYVGVGVVLDFKGHRPTIRDTYFGGPAHRAGLQPGDIVYEVDGFDTAGMDVGVFIDYSRDEVGTGLVYVVGQPGSTQRRTAHLVRSVVPRETVIGTERGDDEHWLFALPDSSASYVKLVGINASTAFEVRRAAERINRQGTKGLVLDLRGCRSTQMREAALVADLFRNDLIDAVMGASETRERRTEYRAGADVMIDPASVVVLINAETRGTPEWLASVLRLAGASVVGEETAGSPFLLSRVSIPGWPLEVRMATGWILDPGALLPQPMGKVIPDWPVADDDRALFDEARTLLQG